MLELTDKSLLPTICDKPNCADLIFYLQHLICLPSDGITIYLNKLINIALHKNITKLRFFNDMMGMISETFDVIRKEMKAKGYTNSFDVDDPLYIKLVLKIFYALDDVDFYIKYTKLLGGKNDPLLMLTYGAINIFKHHLVQDPNFITYVGDYYTNYIIDHDPISNIFYQLLEMPTGNLPAIIEILYPKMNTPALTELTLIFMSLVGDMRILDVVNNLDAEQDFDLEACAELLILNKHIKLFDQLLQTYRVRFNTHITDISIETKETLLCKLKHKCHIGNVNFIINPTLCENNDSDSVLAEYSNQQLYLSSGNMNVKIDILVELITAGEMYMLERAIKLGFELKKLHPYLETILINTQCTKSIDYLIQNFSECKEILTKKREGEFKPLPTSLVKHIIEKYQFKPESPSLLIPRSGFDLK